MIILPTTMKLCVASMAVMELVTIAALRLLTLLHICLILSSICQALGAFRAALVRTDSATPHATIVVLQAARAGGLLLAEHREVGSRFPGAGVSAFRRVGMGLTAFFLRVPGTAYTCRGCHTFVRAGKAPT